MQTINFRIMVPLLFLIISGAASCKKFLAANSQNQTFIETASDLEELLLGEGYLYQFAEPKLFLMDDDSEMGKPESETKREWSLAGFHHWQPEPDYDGVQGIYAQDKTFMEYYKCISRLNVVLQYVPTLRDKGEPADLLQQLAGEAHFLRAYYYFILVNLYGRPFRVQSADTDFGVPLKTDPAVEDQFFSRNPVKEVYDQIIKDLLEAENELADFNGSAVLRPNQAAVRVLLSRVYLYMEDYENAVAYADKVINNDRYRIFDLNQYVTDNAFALRTSPETIFSMGYPSIFSIMKIDVDPARDEFYQVSDDLTQSYSVKDLRLKAFFMKASAGYLKCSKCGPKSTYTTLQSIITSDNFLLRIPEVYLNKAEALGILGRDQDAINTLQELRKNRFKPDDLTSIPETGEALVQFIREERRRELCFECQRWFDLRRYAVNARYPFSKTIRHSSVIFSGTGYQRNGYYELKPYEQDKAAYILPLPKDEVELSNGHLTNEVRPQRPLKQ